MITVNLTTTSERLQLCSATLWSLCNQNVSEFKIYLWVSKEAYLSDKGIIDNLYFIDKMNREFNNIINIMYTENTGPYRKFLPAMNLFASDDIIVYCDDDVVYGKNWLKELLNELTDSEFKCAVASRVRKYKKNIFNNFQGYNSSRVVTDDVTLDDGYIVTGVGGVAFQNNIIQRSLIELNDFLRICPKTDDVWISKLFKLSNVQVKTCTAALKECYEIVHSNNSLCDTNTKSLPSTNMIIINKVIQKIKCYLGIPINNNDISKRDVDCFFSQRHKV